MSSFSVDFNRYGHQVVIDHFNVDPSNIAMREAIRFVYITELDSFHRQFSGKVENRDYIKKEVIDIIERRYDLMKNYIEYFFPCGYKPNIDAVTIAVICDSRIADVVLLLEGNGEAEEDFNQSILRWFSNKDAVLYAAQIQDKAEELGRTRFTEDEDYKGLLEETLFVAHINAFERLFAIHDSFDEIDEEEWEMIQLDDFAKMQTFTDPRNPMGAELLELIQNLRDNMDARNQHISPMPTEPPKGGHLRLVKE